MPSIDPSVLVPFSSEGEVGCPFSPVGVHYQSVNVTKRFYCQPPSDEVPFRQRVIYVFGLCLLVEGLF